MILPNDFNPLKQGFPCLCDRRVDEESCAAPIQLLEPRTELGLTEIGIINTRRRSDAIQFQRIECVTDLSYRAVCIQSR